MTYTWSNLLSFHCLPGCTLCERSYTSDCPEHGPVTFIPDTPIQSRARLSLPRQLCLRISVADEPLGKRINPPSGFLDGLLKHCISLCFQVLYPHVEAQSRSTINMNYAFFKLLFLKKKLVVKPISDRQLGQWLNVPLPRTPPGVFARDVIPSRTCFGPMVGQHCSNVDLSNWPEKDTPQIWKVSAVILVGPFVVWVSKIPL